MFTFKLDISYSVLLKISFGKRIMLQSFVYNGPSIKHKLKKKKIVKKFVRLKTRKDNLSKIRAQKKKKEEREREREREKLF
jgi:hypothetical protein